MFINRATDHLTMSFQTQDLLTQPIATLVDIEKGARVLGMKEHEQLAHHVLRARTYGWVEPRTETFSKYTAQEKAVFRDLELAYQIQTEGIESITDPDGTTSEAQMYIGVLIIGVPFFIIGWLFG